MRVVAWEVGPADLHCIPADRGRNPPSCYTCRVGWPYIAHRPLQRVVGLKVPLDLMMKKMPPIGRWSRDPDAWAVLLALAVDQEEDRVAFQVAK